MSSDGRPLNSLDERDVAVLEMVAWQYTDAEIAVRLAVSEGTVHRRVAGILRKLHVRNRREAARLWLEHEARTTGY